MFSTKDHGLANQLDCLRALYMPTICQNFIKRSYIPFLLKRMTQSFELSVHPLSLIALDGDHVCCRYHRCSRETGVTRLVNNSTFFVRISPTSSVCSDFLQTTHPTGLHHPAIVCGYLHTIVLR